MDSFSVEATVHRIGGTDRWERTFLPRVFQVHPHPRSMSLEHLPGLSNGTAFIRVELRMPVLVRPGLMSLQAQLSDMNGRPVCSPRSVLLSMLPSDVPLYSVHIGPDPESGVYSLGLRCPRAGWLAEDTEVVQAAPEAG